MKISKVNFKRPLSLIVVIAIMAVNCISMFAVTASAETVSVSKEVSAYGTPIVEPAKELGYYLGAATTYPGSDIDIRGVIGGQSGRLTGDVLAAVAPQISGAGEGYNGTYAMKYGTDQGGFYRYLIRYKLEGAMSSLTAVPITVEMKVKLVSGKIKALYAGQYRSSAPADVDGAYTTATSYSSADLSTTEWTTLKFTRTETAGTSRWMFINMVASGSQGAVILIDDLKIYLEDDEAKTNYLTAGNIQVSDTDGYKDYIGGAINVGEFEKTSTYWVTDDIPEKGIIYSYDYIVANNATYGEVGNKITGSNASVTTGGNAPKFTELGNGVKGSYAMEIGGSNAIEDGAYTVTFAATKVPENTKLSMEADVKLVSGSVSSLTMGIIESQTAEKARHSINTTLLSERWTTFHWNQTTSAVGTGWVYFQISLTAPEGGAILHIDNIRIYADGDETKTQVFRRDSDFNLNFDIASFTPIVKDSAESYYSTSFTPSGEWQYDVTLNEETVATTGNAQLVCMENAHSGDYALAIGYGNNQALTNYRVRFGLREMLPGKRYRVSFALAVSGNTFTTVSASLSSAIGNSDISEVLINNGGASAGYASVITESPREWTEVTFDFYEGGTLYDRGSWAYMIFNFVDYKYGVGDSAMFIDSVSINEIDEEGNVIGPNIFIDGDFEYVPNTYDWESYESPYWSEGGADDFTFMNGIEKEIGAYNATVEAGIDIFEGMLTKEPYNQFDTYMLKGNKRDVMIYEATKLKGADKKVWLGVTAIIKTSDTNGENVLVENWKEIILAAANELQVICGDNFQGFYFDEPGYYLTNEEYIEVTKWMRETFKKRVWSVHYKDTINGNEYSKLTITKESHRYTTDVGYWRYGAWDNNATVTLNNFKSFCAGDDPAISVDTRKWMVPILGRHAYYYQTSEQVVEINNNMYEGMSALPNFGGIAFYSMAYDNATVTVEIDENGGDAVLTAIENGVLKCVDTENAIDNGDGTRTYTFMVYGGYYMLDPNDANHVDGHDLVRAKVDSFIEEFAAYNKLLAGDNMIIDGNIIVNDAGATVEELLSSMDISDATVTSGGNELTSGAVVKNGDILKVTTPMGETETYTVIKRYDLNSDGSVNAVDIVRSKKATVGLSMPTALEEMAATALRNQAVRAIDVAAARNYLMQ